MNKIIAIVNPKYSLPILLNAVGHAAVGLSPLAGQENMAYRRFYDEDSNHLSLLTDHPLIIMKAKRERHLIRVIDEAKEVDVALNVFTDAHLTGDPARQVQILRSNRLAPNEIIAIVLAGHTEVLKGLTRRFSLLVHRSEAISSSQFSR